MVTLAGLKQPFTLDASCSSWERNQEKLTEDDAGLAEKRPLPSPGVWGGAPFPRCLFSLNPFWHNNQNPTKSAVRAIFVLHTTTPCIINIDNGWLFSCYKEFLPNYHWNLPNIHRIRVPLKLHVQLSISHYPQTAFLARLPSLHTVLSCRQKSKVCLCRKY